MAANATWFPASLFASEDSAWRVRVAGFYPIAIALAVTGLGVLVLFLLARPRPIRAATTAGVAIVAIVLGRQSGIGPSKGGGGTRRIQAPNIVIIGIDSLRNDLQVPRQGRGATPNIRRFLDDSRRFSDATTPLARTYPSWVSILTGRHPGHDQRALQPDAAPIGARR